MYHWSACSDDWNRLHKEVISVLADVYVPTLFKMVSAFFVVELMRVKSNVRN